MRDFLNADVLFAEILLQTTQRKAVVLVEGPEDVGSIDAHVSAESCLIIPGHGKGLVEGAIALVDQEHVPGVLAILDRDWVGVVDRPLASANVVYTDLYDLDATILMAGSTCARVLASFCDKEKIARHVSRAGVGSPSEIFARPALAVGALRLLSHKEGLGLRLRDFPIEQIIKIDDGVPDMARLITIALSRSEAVHTRSDIDDLIRRVDANVNQINGDVRYCSGHDLLRSLSVFMRKKWGESLRPELLAKAMRAALSCEDLSHTSMYREVSDWASSRRVVVWNC